ncbi:SmdB family multidrug efflux ABC transporter permease/ATP-binding protein [Candidatus Profftia sp. (ex Adelges kitamiensis)]|uniref:SmdB family multidrug efflux ABC transporter permease/ATP-binding protein n=1 Tax=Candidatus Profftia sp. (ex Adelges kitamiensis) TaxID=2864218 RepID=UPI001CE28176|nr:SmdB family multidrug efflux ABC transporter permease/ATP-binding protein [Candidatus Profftia sp. (ex Adelges kitamiensis)]
MYTKKYLHPTLKRLFKYSIPYKKTLSIAVLMLWIAISAEVFCPIIISYFIDYVIFQDEQKLTLIVLLAFLYLFLGFIAASLQYNQSLLFNKAAIGMVQKLRIDLIDAALCQPISIFNNQSVGQLISRITNDTEVIKDLYVTVIATTLKSTTLILIILVAMFMLNWHITLMSICIFPAVIIVIIVYRHYSLPFVRRTRSYIADINNGFHEIINGMEVIQQFCQQNRFSQKIKYVNLLHYHARMQILRLEGFLLRPLLNLFSAMILCGLLIMFSFNPIDYVSVGVLYAFINYLSRLNEPLIELTSQQSIIQQAVVAGERIFEFMDNVQQHYGDDITPLQSGCIDIKNMTFAYQDGVPVLQDINLHIASCGFVALVGHTGSGKTTLANLLMGYYPVNSGEVYIDKRLISTLSHKVLCEGIAIVQQEPNILTESVMYNITLGRNINTGQIWKALEDTQLAALIRSWPQGIKTHLGERGVKLSVGQKQLLAMARVLVKVPKILILDEATAYIDSGTEQAIQKALYMIGNQTTLIIIAHRLSTIIDADSILVLNHGQVVEQGSHKELLTKKGFYYQMHKLQ